VTSKAVFSLSCRAVLLQRACSGVLGKVAVQHCLIGARLFEVHKSIGVLAMTSKAVSACLAEQHCCRGHAQGAVNVVVQHCWIGARLCEVHKPLGVFAMTSKAVFSLSCRAVLLQRACTGCWQCCYAALLDWCKAV